MKLVELTHALNDRLTCFFASVACTVISGCIFKSANLSERAHVCVKVRKENEVT
jgi:hypothetical protein